MQQIASGHEPARELDNGAKRSARPSAKRTCAAGDSSQYSEAAATHRFSRTHDRSDRCRRRRRQGHSVPLVAQQRRAGGGCLRLGHGEQAALSRHRIGISGHEPADEPSFWEFCSTRRGRIVAALLGAGQSDPELLEAFRERFLRPRRQEAYKTLRRGIERGELPATWTSISCWILSTAQSTCASSFVMMN